jgi:hypothetical protein
MLSHLFQIAADWSVGYDEPAVPGSKDVLMPEETAAAVAFLKVFLRGSEVPVEEILKIGRDWVPVPQQDYCPVTFDDSVPENLSRDKVVVSGDYLFVWGYNGDSSVYWKFRRA